MPLLIIILVGTMEVSRVAQASDVKLQQALDNALRAAASCVDKTSQANNDMRIDPARADALFRKVIADNLGLDETTLAPLANSGVATVPAYQLAVVNGTNPYVAEAYIVTCDGSCSATETSTGNLPVTVGVSESGVNIGGAGEYMTTLKSPGCVAVIKVQMKAVTSRGFEVVRWGASRIKTN
jgi:Flp pilus assembly protein TadG